MNVLCMSILVIFCCLGIEQVLGNTVACKSAPSNYTFGVYWEPSCFQLQKVLHIINCVYIGAYGYKYNLVGSTNLAFDIYLKFLIKLSILNLE